MKLEKGKSYMNRLGHKVDILNDDCEGDYQCIGYDHHKRAVSNFTINGKFLNYKKISDFDLISELEEPLDFDWDCLPKWSNACIAMDEDSEWYCFSDKPKIGDNQWVNDTCLYEIPSKHAPKNYTGNWKDSLFKNPNL